MINDDELDILKRGLDILAAGHDGLPDYAPALDVDGITSVIEQVATRMQDNYPYHHPQYAGQMLKPPHPVARIAYALSLWVNPNNHALDGGRASSAMEKECIVDLAAMVGWQDALGHLTGGGTMANLEALWIADRLAPGKRIIGSAQAHYTHGRISEVLGIPYSAVPVDDHGRMRVDGVRAALQGGDVGTVVVTLGNTGLGAVDPLAEILALRAEYDFRLHVDAAYGGYFGLASTLSADVRHHYDALPSVDSVVIDPHKHGLQPYGCGCVLFRDPSVGRIYQHDSPYTYFSSDELHLGEISLECSRPGASAVALWATQQLLAPIAGGEFAASLDRCLAAARDFHARLAASEAFLPLMPPDLDIVLYALAAADSDTASRMARAVFAATAQEDLHLALIELPTELAAPWLGDMQMRGDTVTCLRSVLMRPDQVDWTARIVDILARCAAALD